ncbi:hypothetical protein HDU98_005319 [Podochytrium sp. JEL0797]|nr:hypothetical protein HDU98_005319 [Podochytrium sp. JEL0797]
MTPPPPPPPKAAAKAPPGPASPGTTTAPPAPVQESFDAEGGFAMDFGDDLDFGDSQPNNGEGVSGQYGESVPGQYAGGDPWFANNPDVYATDSYNEQYENGLATSPNINNPNPADMPPTPSAESSKPPPVVTARAATGAPLSGTVGHPLYGSNVAIPDQPNDPTNPNNEQFNIGYPSGGAYNSDLAAAMPNGNTDTTTSTTATSIVETNLVASYKWNISDFSTLSDEKIVSPPFGSADHPWQMVVYPNGAAGSDGMYLSAFLRPLKTTKEIEMGEDWFRPVVRFTIRIHKPLAPPSESRGYGYSEDDDTPPQEETYSYTIGPTHPTATTPDDILIQDFSVMSEFNGFTDLVPGWGFTALLELTNLSTALGLSNCLTLSASIESITSVDWITQSFTWDLHNAPHLISQGTKIQSPSFGPAPDCWTISLVPNASEGYLGGFLEPSPLTATNPPRRISSFTIKIQSPQTEYGYTHSPSHVASKTLTGGFTFREGGMNTGWEKLVQMDQVEGCLDSTGVLRVEVEVTWIAGGGDVVGGVVTTGGGEVGYGGEVGGGGGVEETQVVARIEEAVSEWSGKVEALERDKAAALTKVSELETCLTETIDLVGQETAKSEDLKVELDAARERNAACAVWQEKLAVAKARIAALRAGFEEGVETAWDESKVGLAVYTAEEQQDNFFVLKAKMLAYAADLTVARERIHELHDELTDAKLFGQGNKSPALHRQKSFINESSEVPISVQEAMEQAQAEIEDSRNVMNDFYQRGPFSNDWNQEVLEKSASLADLTMAFAQLSFNKAAVLDSCLHHEPESFPNQNPNSHVAYQLSEIDQLLAQVESQIAYLRSPTTQQQQQYTGYSSPSFNPTNTAMSPTSGAYAMPTLPSSFATPDQQSRIHELEVQLEHFKTQTEMMSQEIAKKDRVEEIRAATLESASMASPSSPWPAGGVMRMGGGGSVVGSTGVMAARGRGNEPPGVWTPVEKDGGPVSAAELTKLLSTLQKTTHSSTLRTTLSLITLLLATFLSYATLHIHCAHPQNESTTLCLTAVPIYTSLSSAWHTAAQKFVLEVVPYTTDSLHHATVEVAHVIDRVDKKVKSDWDRAERERLEKSAREKERWALEKAEKLGQERVKAMEAELIAREKAMVEKWEAEGKLREAERLGKEEEARKALEVWVEGERRKRVEEMERAAQKVRVESAESKNVEAVPSGSQDQVVPSSLTVASVSSAASVVSEAAKVVEKRDTNVAFSSESSSASATPKSSPVVSGSAGK